MNDFDQQQNRPAKRRKLVVGHDLEQPAAGQYPYVALASASLEVSLSNVEKRANVTENPPVSAVSIHSVSQGNGGMLIEVTAPWLRQRAVLHTPYDIENYQLLDDCTQVISTIKSNSDTSRAALVCHDALLRVSAEVAVLEVDLLWRDSSEPQDRLSPVLHEILLRYDRSGSGGVQNPVPHAWEVREFYDNVHVPPKTAENDQELNIDLLHCKLYPFQRRAVRWLLLKEGVRMQSLGQLEAVDVLSASSQLPIGFHKSTDVNGNTIYVNPSIGVTCSSKNEILHRYNGLQGGILAEAMGLGKTVEMIALMCVHTMRSSPRVLPFSHLRATRATLIITPSAILEQWRQEIQEHAPSLKIYHYNGTKATSKKAREKMIEELCDQDVVLTTYTIIARELHYVMEKPDRNLRARPRLEPPKSPLDQVLWWRVCLDEAQMIESGVSAAAQVARLIPRVNAWAVTGTPIKQSHRDLYGLLLFLRQEPWSTSPKLWDLLITYYRPAFRRLMNEMTIRHSKELVRDELQLPPQSRHTISMSFTNIEQAHYSQLFYDMYQDIGVDRNGEPVDDYWDPNLPKTIEKMRTWLTRLRQTCLHPEVGGRNRRALGRHHGPLRTVAQVLDVMIDQTETLLRAEQRTMLIHKVRQGQIFENAKLRDESLKIYSEAHAEAAEAVNACRKALDIEMIAHKNNVKLDKEAPVKAHEDVEADSDIEDTDSPIVTARLRLRSALEVQHMCIFFTANIYFQLKSDEEKVRPESDEFRSLERQETEAYEEAKKIRSELLKEVVQRANRKVARVRSRESPTGVVVIPEMSLDLDYTGIESRKIYEKLYKFCEAMNTQAEQFNQLRQKMVEFLQQALIDEEEGVELQGDEYENSTKHQDEMYVCMEALRALHADRAEAISGQENLLIRTEMKNFLKAAKENEGPAPELMIKYLAERETKRIRISEQGSLRGIIAEIRALVSSLQWSDAAGHSDRAKAEMHVAEQILRHATDLNVEQNKTLAGLEQEVNHFRNSMKARLEYYKSLQKISDTVAPFREEDVGKELDQTLLRTAVSNENTARTKYSTFLAKSRYLCHLKADSNSQASERICTICQSEFEIGTITSCGHVFCKEDIQLWYRDHGNCPVCKRRLRVADFFDISYKPSEMVVQVEETSSPNASRLADERIVHTDSIYSDINERQLNEIKNMDIRGASFGSKVDTICRHLHWLRERDPGAKTLVFSQFREVLDVLARAFRQNTILYSKCDDKNAIQDFKSNPAIEVFLLHARAHSAGLNLVVASHVILCEPLINTALELQAIARVHRIGQHRATTVWMYLIADTVEQSIYDISVKRRLAHIKTKDQSSHLGSQSGIHTPTPLPLQESTIDAANSKELQAADLGKALAPGKNGGEMVDRDDLWPCLFGNPVGKAIQPGFLDAPPDHATADGDVGRFLRFEAAERRRNA